MVGEAHAHVVELLAHLDAHLFEVRAWPNPAEHQQLRRLDGARAQKDFTALSELCAGWLAVGANVLDARGAQVISRALERDARRMHARAHAQVQPPLRALEVRVRRAAALAVALRHLVPAETLLRRAPVVEVVDAPVAELARRAQKRRRQLVLVRHVAHRQGPVDTVVLRGAAHVILRLAVVVQHRVGTPALGAGGDPAVVVRG